MPGKTRGIKYVRLVAGLGLLALLIFYVDTRALIAQLVHLQTEYVLRAAICIAAATLLGSAIAYLVIAIDSAVHFVRFLSFYWVAWAFGLVVPGQVGDVAGLSYLMQRAGLDWAKIIGRALIDKLISLVVMALLATLALVKFSSALRIDSGAVFWIAAAAATIAASVYLFARLILREQTSNVAWRTRARSNVLEVVSFIRANPALVGVNLLGTIAKILLIGTSYWYMFVAGGVGNLNWVDVVLLATVSSLIAYIPVSFNGLGTVEVTGILLFALLGLDEELVLSTYLALRAIVLLIAWIPAAFIIQFSTQK